MIHFHGCNSVLCRRHYLVPDVLVPRPLWFRPRCLRYSLSLSCMSCVEAVSGTYRDGWPIVSSLHFDQLWVNAAKRSVFEELLVIAVLAVGELLMGRCLTFQKYFIVFSKQILHIFCLTTECFKILDTASYVIKFHFLIHVEYIKLQLVFVYW